MYPITYPPQRPSTVQMKHSVFVTDKWAFDKVKIGGKNDFEHHQRVGVIKSEEIKSYKLSDKYTLSLSTALMTFVATKLVIMLTMMPEALIIRG